MGLISRIYVPPLPRVDLADDGLAALVDVDVFDNNFLLAFAAVFVESLEMKAIGSAELVAKIERLFPTLKILIRDHCALETLHCRAMASDHLRNQHPLGL